MKIKRALIFLLIFVSLVLVAIFFGCPINRFFGVECPGCGMTRAFLSALQLDFRSAFYQHPLFGVFAAETVYVIFRLLFPKRSETCKKVELIVFGFSFLLLLIVWIIRQFVI